MNTHTPHPDQQKNYDIAIIGAGLAGSLCANKLTHAGYKVCIIEKSRGSGGRASSKRLANNAHCELGAPFINASHPAIQALLDSLCELKLAAPWTAADNKVAHAYVGTPKMSTLTRHWLQDSDFITNRRIQTVKPSEQTLLSAWHLFDDNEQYIVSTKRIIITAPAAQAATLLATIENTSSLLASAQHASQTTQPQWSMWIETTPSDSPLIVTPTHGTIARIIKDSDKPQRIKEPLDRWVIQMTPSWTVQHLDDSLDSVSQAMIDAFEKELHLSAAHHGTPHRWLLSRTQPITSKQSFENNDQQSVFVAGDWLCQGDAEGALISALSLSEHIKKLDN